MPSTRPNTPTANERRGPIQSRCAFPSRVLPPAVAVGVFLFLAGLAGAQQLSAARSFPSTPDKAVGVVIADSAGGWLVFAVPSMTPVQSEPINSGCGIVWEGQPGRYLVLYFPAGQSFPQPEVTMRDLGVAGPVTPPDVPDPPTPPVPTAGRRLIVILRESADSDTETATTILRMRTDPQLLDRLKAKNHPPPLVLDQDSDNPLVQRLTREIGNSQRPALAVLDYSAGEAGKTISVGPVPTDVDGVIDALGKAGG